MSFELLNLISANNILLYIMVFTRLSGIMATAPIFATYPIPNQVKLWLCATVAFLMYPLIINMCNVPTPNSMPELTIILIKEFFVGFLIGFIARFVFTAVQLSGQIIGIQIGTSISQVLDPTSNEQIPLLGQLYVYLVTIVFLTLNAHFWLFSSVYTSFASIPLGMEFNFSPSLVQEVIYLFSNMFVIAFQIIMPIFCIIFVSEVLLGLVSKMMPQMNIFMVALPFKIFLGLFLILAFLEPTVPFVAKTIESNMSHLVRLFMGG